MTDIKRECKTCKNPYCSRTLGERQTIEVQVHTQYGWECCDKEKYLQNDGGYVLVKKEDFEKAIKSLTPKNEVVDAIAYKIYYTANPDSERQILDLKLQGKMQKEIDLYSPQTITAKMKSARERNLCETTEELMAKYANWKPR